MIHSSVVGASFETLWRFLREGNPDVMAKTWKFGGSPLKSTGHFLVSIRSISGEFSNGEVPTTPPKKKKIGEKATSGDQEFFSTVKISRKSRMVGSVVFHPQNL